MNELERIQDQLERAYRGEAWHGPCLDELLDGVDAETASRRPIVDAHTIEELVRHIIVWEDEGVARLSGAGSEELPPERDWPGGEHAWPAVVEELGRSHGRLMDAIGSLDPSRLDEPVYGSPGTVYYLLHGIVQHNLYHAGQVALLKKLL